MIFETNRDVLNWYEKQPSVLGDATGLEIIDKHITRRMEQLPGFGALNAVNDKITDILALETATTA